jgi:dihydrofolate reductase
MGRIIVTEFLTVDGVMESPEQWQFPHHSPDTQEFVAQNLMSLHGQLLGRVTYEIFSGFWPTQTNNEFGIADKLNSMPKYVVSTTLQEANWNNTSIISGNVVESIKALKHSMDGDIGIPGSRMLIQSLMNTDIIDEFQLLVYPVVLGDGSRLFDNGMHNQPLKLVDSKTFKSGVVALTYQPQSSPNHA